MKDVLIYRSLWNAWFALGIGVSAMGIGLALSVAQAGFGWFFIGIGAVLIVAGILGIRDRRPRVIMSARGLMVRELGNDFLPWEAIVSVESRWLPRSGYCIVLRSIDESTVTFFASGLQVSEAELMHMISARISTGTE